MTGDEFMDLIDQMRLAVLEQAPLLQLPRGSTDDPGGRHVDHCWRPLESARARPRAAARRRPPSLRKVTMARCGRTGTADIACATGVARLAQIETLWAGPLTATSITRYVSRVRPYGVPVRDRDTGQGILDSTTSRPHAKAEARFPERSCIRALSRIECGQCVRVSQAGC
jgi:hypothetical protein